MTDREFNCSTCKSKYARQPDKQRQHQERKGCFSTFPTTILQYRGEMNTPMHSATKINYQHCPARFYSPYWASVINLHSKYEQGIMPFEGSLFDQPAKIVSVFDLIHNLKEESRIKHEETMKKYGQRSKR